MKNLGHTRGNTLVLLPWGARFSALLFPISVIARAHMAIILFSSGAPIVEVFPLVLTATVLHMSYSCHMAGGMV